MRVMLSTSDNPYNPFTQYAQWSAYDEVICGYFTASYLARIAAVSPELSPADIDAEIEEAVDEIVTMNLPLYSPLTGEQVHYIKFKENEFVDSNKEESKKD